VKAQLLTVVGARPNFVKVAPVVHALRGQAGIDVRLLHTGQHYDHGLAGSFFEQLDLPGIDFSLGVGSGTHAEQTAAVLVGVERVLEQGDFSAMLVAGDVNSTMAAALAAAKLGVRVIHLEAGLRSGDWEMPEEINRVVTDRVSDLLLCTSADATENLLSEGIPGDRIELVGNTMIDSLFGMLPSAARTGVVERLGLEPGGFALVTLHRPALVDDPERLVEVLRVLSGLAERLNVVIPLHPRTKRRLENLHGAELDRLQVTEPLEYLEFVALEAVARLVVTDSGGVQEETSVLGIPCLTYRTTTERPVTISQGTNRLVGMDPDALERACADVLVAPVPSEPPAIPFWDGSAGVRAADAIGRRVSLWAAEGPNADTTEPKSETRPEVRDPTA
jgi:UDP-N-acetylglucosamine 2-epimerase (non-hydrolysing)